MQANKQRGGEIFLIFLDLVSLAVSYVAAVYTWEWIIREFTTDKKSVDNVYVGMMEFAISMLIVSVLFISEKKFIQRNNLDEFFHSVKINFMTLMGMVLILFFAKDAELMSRGTVGVTVLYNIFIDFIIRIIVKKIYKKRMVTKKVSQMIVVTSSDRAEKVLKRLTANADWGRRISGVVVLDEDNLDKTICGIKVVANYYSAVDYIKSVVADEVLISVGYTDGKYVKEFISKLEEMGITVYLGIDVLGNADVLSSSIGAVNDIPVISFAVKSFNGRQLAVKRIMDIFGAIVGLIITAIITPFVAIPLLIESPGPLFFKQKRVGKNGRFFYIYKFRSMYKDAEARKAELMAKNEMKGLMFKMTDDPRITKVGKFIRKTSIDELPQFLNVLKGDMSLVGTRPPTVDEFKEYSPYHKRRLSLKPGITGMWQVSGRSDIEDFEEVVRLDLEYIDNWKVSLDIKILLKTVLIVFMRKGSK